MNDKVAYSTFVRTWYADGSYAIFKSTGITPIIYRPTVTNLVGRAVSGRLIPVCLFIPYTPVCLSDRIVGLVVRRPPRERKVQGSNPALRRDFFRGRVIPVTSKLALQWLPCQVPGVIGSVLGLVGPMSVYCDWVR